MESDKTLVFIASGGRTGTMFLGNRLQEVIEDCFSVHEPDILSSSPRRLLDGQLARPLRDFGFRQVVFDRLLGRSGLRVHGTRLITGAASPADCIARVRAERMPYHAGIPQGMIVESYGPWWMFAEIIDQIWPGAALVGIVRDPRTWIRSWQSHQPRYRNGTATEWLPPGLIDPSRTGDAVWAARWNEIGQVGRLAWEWALIAEHLLRAAAANERVRLYRFEDLFAPDGERMRDLVHFVANSGKAPRHVADLDGFTAGRVNRSRAGGKLPDDWSCKEESLLQEICGPVLMNFGY